MTDSDSLRGDPDRAPRLPPVAELETLRSELARVRALLRPRMEETGEAFVAETIRGMLTEIENSRREAAAHRGARAVEAVGAEGELQALRSELALVRAEAGSLRQQRDAFRQERAQARELAHSPDEWAPLEMRVATWRIWLASKGISGTGPLTDEGFRQAFDALEDESRRLTNDRHDELQREIGAQAEDLETLRDEVATERKLARAAAEGHDHVRGILLEIATVFGRVDDLDTLPARQREAVARDNHVRGLLLEIAAVFGSVDDLDTLPARVREAAARGSS